MTASAEFVASLVEEVNALGCELWLDGGWGVDALVNEETRSHEDVDIVVQKCDLECIRDALKSLGFVPMERDDTRTWNFVLVDARDQQIDFHVIEFDTEGNGIYGPPEHGIYYPAEAFSGRGQVSNTPVKCMSAAFQVTNRSGYELRDKDHHDLQLLRSKPSLSRDDEN